MKDVQWIKYAVFGCCLFMFAACSSDSGSSGSNAAADECIWSQSQWDNCKWAE